jgi:hypothetical protein
MSTTVTDRRETVSLIGSDKVEGTAVYGADKKKIGSVQRVMIDKISGKVAYAVVSFGGFLGMGEDYYPLPWSKLDYDTQLGGYAPTSRSISLRALRSSLDRRIGTGAIARTTKKYTSTITNHSGTNLIDPALTTRGLFHVRRLS